MAAYPIGKAVTVPLRERLAHVTYGLNATYNSKKAFYDLTQEKNLAIDFTSRRSPNFFPGDFNPEQLNNTTPALYPYLTIRAGRGSGECVHVLAESSTNGDIREHRGVHDRVDGRSN